MILKIFLFASLLLMAHVVFSQNYKPVSLDKTYEFRLVNSTKKELANFRVDSVKRLNNSDSAYFFNKRVFNYQTKIYSGDIDSIQNIWGVKMIAKSRGEFDFITTWNDTFKLSTKDTNWVFNKKRGITAKSKRRYQTYIAFSDSIIDIALSNGKKIILSKNHGILEGITFIYGNSKNWWSGFGQKVTFENIQSTMILINPDDRENGLASTFEFSTGSILGYKYVESPYNNLEKLFKIEILQAICTASIPSSCIYYAKVTQKNIDKNGIEEKITYLDTIYVDNNQLKGKVYNYLSAIGIENINKIISENYLTGEVRNFRDYSDYTFIYDSTFSRRIIHLFDPINVIDKNRGGSEIYQRPAGLFSSDLSISPFLGPSTFDDLYSTSLVYYKIGNEQYGDSTELFSRILDVEDKETPTTKVNIYPNPSENEMIVDADGFQSVVLIDVFGKEKARYHHPKLDISLLPAGAYIAQVKTVNGTYFVNLVKR